MDKHDLLSGGDGDDQSEDGQLRSPYNNDDDDDDNDDNNRYVLILLKLNYLFCRVFIHFHF